MAHGKKVLLIGLDPKFVDYATLPTHLDEPTLRAGLEAAVRKLRDLGYESDWLLIDRGETAEAVVSAKLRSNTFDCVLIGAAESGIGYERDALVFEQLWAIRAAPNLLHTTSPPSCGSPARHGSPPLFPCKGSDVGERSVASLGRPNEGDSMPGGPKGSTAWPESR